MRDRPNATGLLVQESTAEYRIGAWFAIAGGIAYMAKAYAGSPLEAGAFWHYLREIVYERRIRVTLFRLDIDHAVIVLVRSHLTQELLKLAAALSAYPTLQLGQCLIDRLGRSR
jgi:hypothetical protein